MTCDVCGGMVRDARLCRPCTRELERAIAELPADLRDLQLVATRQAAGPLGLGHGRINERANPDSDWAHVGEPTSEALGDAPWEFAPAAADQIWAASNTITTWVRHVAEARGIDPPAATRGTHDTVRFLRIDRNRMHVHTRRMFVPSPEQPLAPLVAWLLTNIDALRQDEAAAQLHDELTGLHAENERWILGRPGLDEYFGTCDSPDVRIEQLEDGTLTAKVSTCGAHLFATADAKHIDCRTCGVSYTRDERTAAMLRQLTDLLATVRQCASTLTKLGEPVTIDQVRGWLRRGLITQRGVDQNGDRMVRVGDVRDQRLAMIERAMARRKPTAA